MTAHDLIERLTAANIHFSLSHVREKAVMFHVAVPGERWEVEVFAHGHVEVERFISVSGVEGPETLSALIEQHKD